MPPGPIFAYFPFLTLNFIVMANRENLREKDRERISSPGREQKGGMQNPKRQEELRKGSERDRGDYGRRGESEKGYEQKK